MLGRTASPTHDLLRYPPHLLRLPLPRTLHNERLKSKLWICQHCYHHSQRPPDSERGRTAAQRDHRQRLRASRIAFSKSYSRALSTGTDNADDKPRSDLPSQQEGRRSHMSKRFSHLMDDLQSNIFIAGQRLNDLTGYSGIETLKKEIEQQGQFVIGPLPATTVLNVAQRFRSKPREQHCKRRERITRSQSANAPARSAKSTSSCSESTPGHPMTWSASPSSTAPITQTSKPKPRPRRTCWQSSGGRRRRPPD